MIMSLFSLVNLTPSLDHDLARQSLKFCKFQQTVNKIETRRLVNVRSHMMFRPELIYNFDLIVNQMKR